VAHHDAATRRAAHLGHPFPFPDHVFVSVNTKEMDNALLYSWDCVGNTLVDTRPGDQITGCTTS
jgi:hypothetical protein